MVEPAYRGQRYHGGRRKGGKNTQWVTRAGTGGSPRKTALQRELEREAWWKSLGEQGQELSDAQWQALKTQVLLELVKHPGPNSSASLNAIKELDRQREQRQMGTREAVKETRARCKNRLSELDALMRWAVTQGVSGITKAEVEQPAGGNGSKGAA